MNFSEFKAWFEGFSEGIDKTPSAKQWAKINEKIADIKPEPTKIEYIRQYYDHYRPYYPPGYWWGTNGVGIAYASSGGQLQNKAAAIVDNANFESTSFNADFATEAFKAMGRAEFAAT